MLTELDVVQARALRICLGAIRTSPVCALQVEAGEMPLWIRRKQLVANYWINLRGHGENHPTKKVLQNCWEKERRKKESFGWTGDLIAKEMDIYDKEFASTVVWTNKPIWTMENTKVDIELLIIKGSSGITDIVNEYYIYIWTICTKIVFKLLQMDQRIYKQRQRDLLYISLDIMWE